MAVSAACATGAQQTQTDQGCVVFDCSSETLEISGILPLRTAVTLQTTRWTQDAPRQLTQPDIEPANLDSAIVGDTTSRTLQDGFRKASRRLQEDG